MKYLYATFLLGFSLFSVVSLTINAFHAPMHAPLVIAMPTTSPRDLCESSSTVAYNTYVCYNAVRFVMR